MSREKQKVYEKIQKDFQKDTIAGAKLKKDLPLLATNLNNPEHLEFLFKEYKKQGLIPKKFKSADQLKNNLQKQLYAIWNKISKEDPTVRNDKGFRIAFFNKKRQELLSNMVQKEAISKLTPAQKANPEIMDQISKMRWKGLPIKVNDKGKLSFDRRYFQDKVSKRVIEYANKLEPGLGDKWAKEMRASWNAIGERNRAIKANSGLSFDIGHFIPSILNAPNVGVNAAPEPSSPNRSKGGTPFTGDRNLARQLGIPETWMQSFTDWHLRQQGMDPNLLPKGYELKGSQVVDAASGISDPNLEIAKNRTKFELDQQKIPEGKLQSDLEIVDGQVVKKARKTPKYQVLQIYKNINNASNLIPTPVKRAAIVGGALLPGALGTTASAFEVIDRGEKYEKTKNWLDGIQLGLANASLFTGWTGVGEIIATPADLLNLGLDLGRFPRNPIDTANRQRYRHGKR